MANRKMNQFRYSLLGMPVDLFARVTIGGTGAPTLDTANSKGFKSIVRNSAGDYTITLQDGYNKFLSLDVTIQNATGIPASPTVGVKAESVASNPGTLRIVFSTGGVATDPASGDIVYMCITANNSTV